MASENRLDHGAIRRGHGPNKLYIIQTGCGQEEHYTGEISNWSCPEEKSVNCPHQRKIKHLINSKTKGSLTIVAVLLFPWT